MVRQLKWSSEGNKSGNLQIFMEELSDAKMMSICKLNCGIENLAGETYSNPVFFIQPSYSVSEI